MDSNNLSKVGTPTEFLESGASEYGRSRHRRLSRSLSITSQRSNLSEVRRPRRDSVTSRRSFFGSLQDRFFGDDRKHTARLKNEIDELTEVNRKLSEKVKQQENDSRALKKLLELFNAKLIELLDVHHVNLTPPSINVQIGDQNTMTVSDTNKVLVSYFETLKDGVKRIEADCETIKERTTKLRELDDTVDKLKNENEKLTHNIATLQIEKEKFQEVVDNLRDIQESMDTRDKNSQTLKLDYTLSLTDPSMMEKCLSDLKKIENLQDRHCFRDISKNAQFGVMRILRKYCQKDPKVTTNEFAETLGVDVHLVSDHELDEDDCTDILVKWVKQSQFNTSVELFDKYPKLQKYGSVRGNLGSQFLSGSMSMFDIRGSAETAEVLSEMKDWLTKHIRITNDTLISRILHVLRVEILQQMPMKSQERRPSI